MLMSAAIVETPYFVLRDGNRRIGPEVLPLHSEVACTPIYGFSEKVLYSKFRDNCQLALTPYPLVKFYLRSQTGSSSQKLNLVVIDAAGPREPCVHAATMEEVLEAQENQTPQVTASYRLLFNEEANAYRVEEASG